MKDILKFRGEYFFLSNFAPCEIEYNGVTYPTSEHAFQGAKMSDKADSNKIAACKTPGDAKRLGRKLKMRDDWESVKENVMYEILKIKFSKPEFRSQLLKTGNAHIEEGNNHGDRYWGTVDRQGKNRLGIIIMKIRDELKD